ncbi:MAG TPA: chemotaxis protein [Nitrosopumilaceae archaeon]|nr:chemotaxis protein [Nitrosopumilaceae archaeon]
MPKKQKTNSKGMKFSKTTAIGIGVAVVVVSLVAYFVMNSSNSGIPLFTPARNNFLVAKYYQDAGYAFVSKSTTSGKKSPGASSVNPTIHISKDSVEAVHMINEDSDTGSKHNINIDEFNVHSRDLGYFESQEITFVANKVGTFSYYCSIHPEMKGNIIVE